MLLRQRKSPQGRHPPHFFRTMWRGELQLLCDRCTMPAASMESNSARAASSLTGSSLLNLAVTGWPVVEIWCCT
jgi:hypothetical protein